MDARADCRLGRGVRTARGRADAATRRRAGSCGVVTASDQFSAEQRLLGAILLDNEVLVVVRTMVRPDDFVRDAHQHIFALMLELRRRFREINLETVTNGLRAKGTLD